MIYDQVKVKVWVPFKEASKACEERAGRKFEWNGFKSLKNKGHNSLLLLPADAPVEIMFSEGAFKKHMELVQLHTLAMLHIAAWEKQAMEQPFPDANFRERLWNLIAFIAAA